MTDRDRIRSVLEANMGNASDPHSWRCSHPDLYPDYCTCVSDVTDEIVAALAKETP